ncbi:MAG: hydantoinase B/oxoprolinase family protein, partial [Gammaproteobacteria bacterium]|nr:hydantoinase B/oxoprolinase family protein [Gammaproteobacteria bacterium]
QPGATLTGPAIVSEANSTTVLEVGWSATVNPHLQLLLSRAESAAARTSDDPVSTADPVMLEIINNYFVYIAEEMGTALRKTARSVNIKERLDFSCALFTADGDLIANAPHVPVHLGSMDDSVKSALRECADALRNGAVVLSNAPYNGGTHLPDITAISAQVDDGEIRFIVASRAHHADIGGTTPGSMPPFSRTIHEEGVLFDHFVVLEHGELREAALREQLASGEHPARNPDQNVADFRAQIAANETGRRLLREMQSQFGAALIDAYAQHVQTNAEEAVREVIDQLGEGRFTYPLDSGQQICVHVTIDRSTRSAVIDFSGTSPAIDNNLNAPKAVCQAAVMYVFRTLVQADIPLNAGCRRPLRLIIPDDCMLNPEYPAAVVGGNVETSQCIVDALYGALGVLAGSQGTMNNVSFGNDLYQYYETVGGGSGAGPDFCGADAVQTHMTNTRITDPEVIETRYPVVLREFAIRDGSGGDGRHRGGHGVIRKIEFRVAMSAAVLSNNRSSAPFGLHGGTDGQPGRNAVQRHDGTTEEHGGVLSTDMAAGDVLIIETPGGGGSGTPQAT